MKCIQNNIVKVKDFMIDGIIFMTYEEFVNIHGRIMNFLEYYSIINSIKYSVQKAHLIDGPVLEKR